MPSRAHRPVAVVAGASGLLGRAIAARLAGEGFDLVLGFRRRGGAATALARRCESRGARVRRVGADLASGAGRARLLGAASRGFGRLDAVVCGLGDFRTGRAARTGTAALRSLLASNLEIPFALAREALPRLPGPGGRVVFLGQAGAAAARARVATAGYAAAKAGLVVLARSLAREVAPRGITVNLVAPGVVAGSRGARPARKSIPARRLPRAEEVAAAVAFLLSDEAASVTGAEIPVSGGFGL